MSGTFSFCRFLEKIDFTGANRKAFKKAEENYILGKANEEVKKKLLEEEKKRLGIKDTAKN